MERMKKVGITARGRLDCTPDRAQGWTALEEAVLDARHSVRAAFGAFDPSVPLRSARGRATGRTWADLLGHTLGRGVSVALAVGDPGPGCQAALDALGQQLTADAQGGRRPAGLHLEALVHPAARVWAPAARHRMTVALVDDRVLFVARQGLTPFEPDPRDITMLAHGPMVTEGLHFLDEFADICAGRREPSPARRLLRSCARPGGGFQRFLGLQTVANEVEAAHHMLIRRAERQIYIETQNFDSLALARHLAQRAQAMTGLNLVLILPAAAAGRRLHHCLRLLMQGFGDRLLLARAPGGCTNVSVFDGETALAGSVDLGLQSLRRDTGVSLYLRRADGVPALHAALMRHWVPDLPVTAAAADWRVALRAGVPDLLIAA